MRWRTLRVGGGPSSRGFRDTDPLDRAFRSITQLLLDDDDLLELVGRFEPARDFELAARFERARPSPPVLQNR